MIRVIKGNVERIIEDKDLGIFKQDGFRKIDDVAGDEKNQKKVPLSRMKLEDLKILAAELGLSAEGLNCDELRKIIKDAQEGK